VLGSILGTRIDMQQVFELHAAGKTEIVYERRRLEDMSGLWGDPVHAADLEQFESEFLDPGQRAV
jgi:hypothetical protein